MEQRSLRLGDNVDDYCPRERRVTDHVIVAIVGDTVRQTRCTACDAEHEYKEAKVPRTKLKNGETGLTGGILKVPRPAAPANGATTDAPAIAAARNAADEDAPSAAANPPASMADVDDTAESDSGNRMDPLPGTWIGHRPLIRATLPKTENDVPPPRAIPEFTMHQRQGRGFGGRGAFRHGFGATGGRSSNGFPPGREPNGNGPDGNRPPGSAGPGGAGPGGKSRHRRRHRRPR